MEKRHDIFISYRKKDGWNYARLLQSELFVKGYNVFFDYEDIKTGNILFDEIAEVINNSLAVLMILTPKYIESLEDDSSFIFKEIKYAFEHAKTIIPIIPSDSHTDNQPLSFNTQNDILGRLSVLRHYSVSFNDRTKLALTVDNLDKQAILPAIGQFIEERKNQKQSFWGRIKSKITKKETTDLLNIYNPHNVDFDIFISYRRMDGRDHARNIQLALKAKGYKNIFFDYESIQKGEFTKRIIDAIYSCNDFILVLSPKSMKRCGNEGDPVANEIRAAKKYKKNIIPVTIDNKPVKWPRSFPKELDFIKDIQFHDHKSDSYFDDSIDDLCTKLTTKLD